MAAVTTPSGLTELTNYIDAEYISRMLNLKVQTPKTYTGIVRPVSLAGLSSRTYTHVIRSHMAAAAAVTETDEVGSVSLADAQNQVSSTLVAQATFVSEQALGTTVLGGQLIGDGVGRVSDAVRLYIDDLVHGQSANMTNTMGSAATVHDMSNWNTMLSTFAAQAGNVDSVTYVGHPDASRDLGENIFNAASSILGNDAAGSLFTGAASGHRQGMRFNIGGVPVMSTDEVPVADTTGWGGYLCTTGADGAIGLIVKRELRVDTWAEPKRFGVWLIGSADIGVGILDQDRCLEVISQS